MTLKVWCQTDVGLRRESNQDFFLIDEDIGLYIVADGMGGHRGGEVASRMAAESLHKFVKQAFSETGQRRLNPRTLLVQAYEEACHRVFDTSREPGSELVGMGTTLVAAFYHEKTLHIGNVGDSRAYLIKDGKIWQITEDHSLLNEQLRAGLLSEQDVSRFASKNVITRSVGYERVVQVDVLERQIQPGEMILIYSDGLSGLVTDQRIAEICQSHQVSEIVSICIDEAKKNGGDDNVTVMLIYAEPRSN